MWTKASNKLPELEEWVLILPNPSLNECTFLIGRLLKNGHPSFPLIWDFWDDYSGICELIEDTYWQSIPESLSVFDRMPNSENE